MKTCIACGMPMRTIEDYPLNDESKDYCKFCANEDGSMHSYEQKLKGMSAFLVNTQGIDTEVAQEMAKKMMEKLPAWRDYSE
ncbi:hypothetical protein M2475_000008 [Breznakia sp. PF5-3]|uniref:zinc ribbon domain-containing protein n=1 Tax=unclassified Breznakia TaxID=2623764 RepID=UPI002405EE46|nr:MULTISPECIES: zinc ribbon domain-containing protein [unclassified Breznakia]MDF9823661.1 hypothetical protein [Breznakia sp. PM6-1]MDF9834459.1 hypothetical protein [Breznakia sp. PF5-3]